MPKTYNTIPTVSTGTVYTATAHNNIVTNINNYRVPPMCRIHRAAALSHTSNGNYQTVTFDTQTFTNTDGMWASSPNPERITVTTAGLYLITANVSFTGNATGTRALQIVLNGATELSIASVSSPTVADGGIVTVTTTASLSANDYITALAFQNSGGNLAYVARSGAMHLSATWLGQVS